MKVPGVENFEGPSTGRAGAGRIAAEHFDRVEGPWPWHRGAEKQQRRLHDPNYAATVLRQKKMKPNPRFWPPPVLMFSVCNVPRSQECHLRRAVLTVRAIGHCDGATRHVGGKRSADGTGCREGQSGLTTRNYPQTFQAGSGPGPVSTCIEKRTAKWAGWHVSCMRSHAAVATSPEICRTLPACRAGKRTANRT